MAGRTADALVDMNAVIKVNEPGKIVNPGPLDGFAAAKAFSHGRQHGTISPNLRVTIHAGLCRWNPRERAVLDRGMAITAINSIVPNVVLVAERNRLNTSNSNLAYIRGLVDSRQSHHQQSEKNDSAENAHFGDGIGAGMKYLGHRAVTRCRFEASRQARSSNSLAKH